MRIYIPTYGRHLNQVTFRYLPRKLQEQTVLVVQRREAHLYEDYPTVVLPRSITTIAPTRNWIVHEHHDIKDHGEKLVMLDDDIRFDRRRVDDNGKFIVATERDVLDIFREVERKLEKYAHVGVLAREGGHQVLHSEVYATRMVRFLAYHVPLLKDYKIKFNRLSCMEDFDVTLQLLKLGYTNVVLCKWAQGQGRSGAAGGCSHFRTLELHEENAKKLAKLHHPYVKLVRKQTKGAWGGSERTDVTIQWKKAYESSSH